ncbi:Catabolic 3-dehydroquinate dehydratase [subsurface metagenome]
MICVAISDKSIEKCLAILDVVDMAEIRLDLTDFGIEEIDRIFAHPTPQVATCRPEKKGPQNQLKRLIAAIRAGASYVDIEVEASRKQRETIIDIAREYRCKVIISYHNFDETPGLRELYKIVDKCYDLGADIAKVATYSKSGADSARLLSLYSNHKPLIALGMGHHGKITRIVSPLLGAEFTFASMDEGEETAEGQIKYSKLKEIIGRFKDI